MDSSVKNTAKHPRPAISELQALYFMALLRRKIPLWNQEATARALSEAKIDIIPHQVEAAAFAFRNPLSRGVILADEVGLGKTVEAGLVATQLWFGERKRRILVICPKSLRGQWKAELLSLFGLASKVIETSIDQGSFAKAVSPAESLLIMTEHTACKFLKHLSSTHWDLVLIDEAHKLRNAWKEDAKSRSIKLRTAFRAFRKLLLTATPFQNNLMELYGLCSFIDERVLGTVSSFKRTFAQLGPEDRAERLSHLRERMSLFFHRELRRNVLEYVKYTDRHAITVPYEASPKEEELRQAFESYLRQEVSHAIPARASHLLRLVYFKLLASSPLAMRKSLINLSARMARVAALHNDQVTFDRTLSRVREIIQPDAQSQKLFAQFEELVFQDCPTKSFQLLRSVLTAAKIEDLTGVENEWVEQSQVIENDSPEQWSDSNPQASQIPSSSIRDEAELILRMLHICFQLKNTSKGDALRHVLQQQFSRSEQKGWPKKAVIFTEFKSTQDYIVGELEKMGLVRGRDIVLFNGDSGDSKSRERLVEQFRDQATIFLTTEAGSEGLNLQFCNLVVNFDLPWNPQRIEQRIGRCHRYKQPLDVMVVNFVNNANPADQRIVQLLQEKFHLFEGVFGASDQVLGDILDGTDFERKIFELYLKCRTADEIEQRFDELMSANSERIEKTKSDTIQQLSTMFSGHVLSRMKGVESQIGEVLGEQARLLKSVLSNAIPPHLLEFDGIYLRLREDYYGFKTGVQYCLSPNPKNDAELLNPNHPAVNSVPLTEVLPGTYRFKLAPSDPLGTLKGSTGVFWVYSIAIAGMDSEELIIPLFIKATADGHEALDEAKSVRLIEGPSERVSSVFEAPSPRVETVANEELLRRVGMHRQDFDSQCQKLFSEEMSKVRWLYEDQIKEIEMKVQDLKETISETPGLMKSANSAARENELEAAQEKLERELIQLEEKRLSLQKQSWDAKHARRGELEAAVTTSETIKILARGSFIVD
jgi:ERCC4-related helicase